MKILNSKLEELFYELYSLSEVPSLQFAEWLNDNLNLIEKETDKLFDLVKYTKEYTEFEDERIKLCEENAIKKDWKPLIEEGKYKFKNKSKFEKLVKELKNKYKEAIDIQEANYQEYKRLLDEEVELDLKRFEWDLPNSISLAQLNILKKYNLINK